MLDEDQSAAPQITSSTAAQSQNPFDGSHVAQFGMQSPLSPETPSPGFQPQGSYPPPSPVQVPLESQINPLQQNSAFNQQAEMPPITDPAPAFEQPITFENPLPFSQSNAPVVATNISANSYQEQKKRKQQTSFLVFGMIATVLIMLVGVVGISLMYRKTPTTENNPVAKTTPDVTPSQPTTPTTGTSTSTGASAQHTTLATTPRILTRQILYQKRLTQIKQVQTNQSTQTPPLVISSQTTVKHFGQLHCW